MSRVKIESHNCFVPKILRVNDCSSTIISRFPANSMIPQDQGGGGYTLGEPGIPKMELARSALIRRSADFLFAKNSQLDLDVPA